MSVGVRQADVVLGEAGQRGRRGRGVAQLGQLQPPVERVAGRVAVQHRGHPPGEVLGPPDPAQAGVAVRVEQVGAPVVQRTRRARARERAHVGDREVHALGAGRRDDVRGVAGEEQPPVPHGLGDEAAHRRDALLHDRAAREREAVGRQAHAAARPRCGSSGQSRDRPRPAAPAGRAG